MTDIEKYYDILKEAMMGFFDLFKNANAFNDRGFMRCSYEPTEAIEDFTKAIELNPRFDEAYYNRGNVWLLYKSDYDKAIADYNKAIEINPKDPEYYIHRAFVWEEKGDHDRAIADYTKAIELKPYDDSLYFARSGVYKQKGDNNKSIADLTKANELFNEDCRIRSEVRNSIRNKLSKDGISWM